MDGFHKSFRRNTRVTSSIYFFLSKYKHIVLIFVIETISIIEYNVFIIRR
nr:MAG TPA: hypothetical protein [Caudoviricetes sp.]